MARRLDRTVRRVGPDMVVAPGAQHRSITDGCNSTSFVSARPTDSPKDARRLAANSNALARSGVGAEAATVTSLAKRAAAHETERGVNRSIVSATEDIQ
jgi:hypothetical protein